MYKILVVDDIATNRRVLKLILSELENVDFFDAENGEDAIAMTNDHQPDIIFMDIMMPKMDGIEATRIIKQNPLHQKIFIFAITALDDNTVKSKMLDAGASDFVNKPFDDEELLLRTKNYLSLIQGQSSERKVPHQRHSINTYEDSTISNVRTVLAIENSNDLESILHIFETTNLYPKSHYNDITTLVITIASVLFKAGKLQPFDIIFEHSDNFYYLTIWNEIFAKAASKYFDKFSSNIESHYLEHKLSFRIKRSLENAQENIEPTAIENKTPIEEKQIESAQEEEPTNIKSIPKEKVIYDFIETEDLGEIEENLKELNSNLMLFSSGSLSDDDFNQISRDLDSIAKALQFYPLITAVASSIIELSDALHTYREGFMQNAGKLGPLFMGFGNDLELWIDSLFYSGTSDLNFLDSTFQSNCEMIVNFAKDDGTQESVDDMDDIFDF